MATGPTADVVWVDVLPSLDKFVPQLRSKLSSAGIAALGSTAGRSWGNGFSSGASAGIDGLTRQLTAARRKQEDAAGRVRVAELRLTDVQNSSRASAAQLAQAEETLASRRRALENTTDAARLAEKQLDAAKRESRNTSHAVNETHRESQGLLTGLTSRWIKVAAAVGTVTYAMYGIKQVAGVIGDIVGAASDLEEEVNKSSVVFGVASERVLAWSKTSSQALGQSRVEALQASGQFGNLFRALGLTEDASADMSVRLVELASDLASFNNQDPSEVLLAMRAGLVGEAEPMRRFGVDLSDLALRQEALNLGIYDGSGILNQAQKAQAAYSVLLKSTTLAQGDFARTSDQLANSQRILKAEWENAKSSLGALLIGPATSMVHWLIEVIPKISHAAESSRGLFKAIGDGFRNSTGALQHSGLMGAFETVGRVVRGVYDYIAQLAEIVSSNLRTGLRQAEGPLQSLGQSLSGLYPVVSQVMDVFRSLVLTVVENLAPVLPAVIRLVAQLASALGTALSGALDDLAPVLPVVADTLGQVAKVIADVLLSALNGLAPLLPAVAEAFGDVASVLGSALLGVVKQLAPILPPLAEALARLALEIGQALVNALGLVAPLLPPLVTALGALAQVAAGALVVALNILLGIVDKVADIFGALPGPVQGAIVAFAALRVAMSVGIFDSLLAVGGRVLSLFGTLKTAVGVAALEMGAAYRQASAAAAFTASVEGSSVAAARFTGAISGLGAAAGAAARGGLAALKTGLGGLMGILGGPWGVALAGATLGIGFIVAAVQRHNQAVEQATREVTEWYKAMAQGGQPALVAADKLRDKQEQLAAAQARLRTLVEAQDAVYAQAGRGASAYASAINQQRGRVEELNHELEEGKRKYQEYYDSLSPLQQLTEDVGRAQTDLQLAIREYGPASAAAAAAGDTYRGALARQKEMQDALNAAQQTHLQRLQEIANQELKGISATLAAEQAQLQLADAVDRYNADAQAGTLSTRAMEEASNNLAQQAYGLAQAQAQAAVDTAKANGVTDDGTIAQRVMLESLRNSANQITGPGRDALLQMIATLEKSTATTSDFSVMTATTGAQFVQRWGTNGVELANVTAAMRSHLENLGYTVKNLPNGNVAITADTSAGQAEINKFIAGVQGKTVAMFGNFVPRPGVVVGNATGNILSPMAGGSATIVKPNTWRIIGDNMRSDEAYIPIEPHSARSQKLLEETARRMGHVIVPASWDPQGPNGIGLAFGGIVQQNTRPQAPGTFRMPQSMAVPVTMTIKQTIEEAFDSLLGGLGFSMAGAVAGPEAYQKALAFARAQSGKPYVWGGVGPGGFDCSGFMSAILNVIRGRHPYSRVGATANFPWAGGRPGVAGPFAIGSTPNWGGSGVGHMAGTLLGVPVESWGGHGPGVGKVPTGGAGNRNFIRRASYDGGGLLPDRWAGINTSGDVERVLNPPQDDYFRRFVDISTRLVSAGGDRRSLIERVDINVRDNETAYQALDELEHRLRVADLGGRYAWTAS